MTHLPEMWRRNAPNLDCIEHLRHPENLARAKQRVPWRGWKEADCKLLREKFVTVKRIADLIDVFGGRFELGQIKAKARRMELKRKFLGDANVRVEGHQELNDQIRIRAKEDGIPLYKLDAVLGTGSYFKYNAHRRRANLRAVARAIEFFGGTLVIDWRDH